MSHARIRQYATTFVHVFFAMCMVVSASWPLLSHAQAQQFTETIVNTNTSGGNCGTTGAGGFVPLACFENSPKLSQLYSEGDLANYLSKIFLGAIALGGILAVLRLSWAGFVYMSSDLWSSKGHAKEIIQETMLGLFLLLAIWLILNLINPDLLKLKVEPKTTNSTPGQSNILEPIRDPRDTD